MVRHPVEGNKLLRVKEGQRIVIREDPLLDNHKAHGDLPAWQGTVVGIDIGVPPPVRFSTAFQQISKAFRVHLQARKKAGHRKPRFVR